MRVKFGLTIAAALVLVAGCEVTEPQTDVIEVCNSAGCVAQPSGVVTYDPGLAVPDPDPEDRLGGLIAAAEFDPRAAHDLGIRYMRGDGIRRNPWEGIKWMRNAAERGELRAQSALGRLYLTGLEETGPDYNEAEKWLNLAAGRGDREAATLLVEARAARADEAAFQTQLDRWRQVYTANYWYRGPYYGYYSGGGYRYY